MKELESAFDWAGIDYFVQQTPCKTQTQITINTADIERLVNLIVTGSKYEEVTQ